MTKNRQFHFYQQTKNCQLTDDRILLTEKTFTLIFCVITIADPLITPWMTISRPPSF